MRGCSTTSDIVEDVMMINSRYNSIRNYAKLGTFYDQTLISAGCQGVLRCSKTKFPIHDKIVSRGTCIATNSKASSIMPAYIITNGTKDESTTDIVRV